MTRSPGHDKDLDDIGPDLDALAARYHADSAGVEPPHHVDAQLRAAAHRAVDAKPRTPGAAPSPQPSLMRRMRAPFGLAATIVAVASITVALWKESPEKLAIPSDHPAVIASRSLPAAPSTNVANQTQPVSPTGQVTSPAALGQLAPPASLSLESNAAPAAERNKDAVARSLNAAASPAAPVAAQASKTTEIPPAKRASAASKPVVEETPAPVRSLDRVTVTGSNLKRADTETPSPAQQIDASPADSSGVFAPASAQAVAPPAPAVVAVPSPPPPPAPPAPALSPSMAAPVSPPPSAAAYSPPPPAAAPLAAAAAPIAMPPPPAVAPPAPMMRTAPNIAAKAAATSAAEEAATPAAEQASLIAALQTAVDANDTTAARVVLETLMKNYPHADIPAKLRLELTRIGVRLPKTKY